MNFGQALDALKAGKRVARAGWNGRGMWVYMVPGNTFPNSVLREPLKSFLESDDLVTLPHLDMKTATGEMCVGWLASQTDMLADDWQVVGE